MACYTKYMENTVSPIDQLRHEELKEKVKVDFIARLLRKFYTTFGEFLYNGGYISEITDSDSLTGLYNRNFFERWVSKVLAQASRNKIALSFVYVDVNGLKQVNDFQGHKAGDKLLKTFSKRLASELRDSDLAFRLGGDEFAIILWSCDKENATKKILAVREKLEKDNIRFSFGIVEAKGRVAVKGIIKEADALMYEMKREMKKNLLKKR